MARFREDPASTHQALGTVAHGRAMPMVTIKGIIVRVEQEKLCDWLRWKLSQRGLDYCLMEAVVASERLKNAYQEGLYLVGDGKVSISS